MKKILGKWYSMKNAKELFYYLFFILMVFAKGIGLDSGDKLYYILSGAAFICILLKLILTEYSKKELAAIILLSILALIAYRNSGRMGIMLSVLAIIGMKGINIRKLFRVGAMLFLPAFVSMFFLSSVGIIHNPLIVHEKGGIGEIIRWGMGYSTGNVFHISYFILTVFLCYSWEKEYNLKKGLLLMLGNIIVFVFSLSYTGIAVTTFYLILAYYAVKRKRLSKAERILCQFPLPLCLVFSFGAPFLLNNPFIAKLDAMLQARLSFSHYYLASQQITLFGTRMKNVPNFWIIMDNSYVYFLMTFGFIAFLLFGIGYAIIIGRYSGIGKKVRGANAGATYEKERMAELAIIFSVLLYGIMEQFLTNAFMNLSLLFMGELLYGNSVCREETIYQNKCFTLKNKKKMLPLAIVLSMLAWISYFIFIPVPNMVKVPMTSLNYVEAESFLVHVQNEEGTKDGLYENMSRYEELITDKTFMQEILNTSEEFSKLTPEMIAASMEFSLPQYIHSSRVYDTFRVRMLKLYSTVPDTAYKDFLSRASDRAGKQIGGALFTAENVYSDRIGKSFGEDRMEHMDLSKAYMVERSGSIVRIEYIRGSIISALFGFMAGLLLFLIINLMREKRKR